MNQPELDLRKWAIEQSRRSFSDVGVAAATEKIVTRAGQFLLFCKGGDVPVVTETAEPVEPPVVVNVNVPVVDNRKAERETAQEVDLQPLKNLIDEALVDGVNNPLIGQARDIAINVVTLLTSGIEATTLQRKAIELHGKLSTAGRNTKMAKGKGEPQREIELAERLIVDSSNALMAGAFGITD